MSGLDELLSGALGGSAIGKIASMLGSDEGGTQNALSAALPQLIGRLQSNASTTDGANALDAALGKHDGSVLDDVNGYLDRGDHDGSQGRFVSKVFGDDRESTVNSLAGQTGMDMSKIVKLLGILGPIVLGAMSKSGARSQGSGGLAGALGGLFGGGGGAGGAGGLGGLLGGLLGGGGAGGGLGALLGDALGGGSQGLSGAANLSGSGVAASGAASVGGGGAGGAIGKVSGMLDRDGDGSPINDIQKMAKSGFGQKLLGMLKKR